MANLTIAYESEERNYVALYLDGNKIADMQGYELDAYKMVQILKSVGQLPYLEVDEIELELDYDKPTINFPDSLLGESTEAWS